MSISLPRPSGKAAATGGADMLRGCGAAGEGRAAGGRTVRGAQAVWAAWSLSAWSATRRLRSATKLITDT
jgi:hypothetical protein